MFEDGAKLDDIMNVLKPPTLDDDDKKNQRIPDSAIRYEVRKSVGEDSVKFTFAGNSEVLR